VLWVHIQLTNAPSVAHSVERDPSVMGVLQAAYLLERAIGRHGGGGDAAKRTSGSAW
jgi:hypothetical protein